MVYISKETMGLVQLIHLKKNWKNWKPSLQGVSKNMFRKNANSLSPKESNMYIWIFLIFLWNQSPLDIKYHYYYWNDLYQRKPLMYEDDIFFLNQGEVLRDKDDISRHFVKTKIFHKFFCYTKNIFTKVLKNVVSAR